MSNELWLLNFTSSFWLQFSRNFATATGKKEEKIKVIETFLSFHVFCNVLESFFGIK